MLRRELLRVLGLGAMRTPRRPDQRQDPPPAVVAPGSQTGIFRGRLVQIIGGAPPGFGLFVYNPTLAFGNLLDSVAAVGGHDQKGNLVLVGITNYTGGAPSIAIQTNAGFLRFSQAATEAGPYIPFGTIGPDGTDFEIIAANSLQLFTGVASFIVANNQLNMGPGGGAGTGVPINILDQSQPSTPGLGVKLWSGATGHLETVSNDGGVYDTERKTIGVAIQLINHVAFNAMTGISFPVAAGTYKFSAHFHYASTAAAGVPQFQFTGPTTTNAYLDALFGGVGAAVTMPVRGQAFTTVMNGPTLASADFVVHMHAQVTFTGAGTVTLTAATSIAVDTYTISGGEVTIEPVN